MTKKQYGNRYYCRQSGHNWETTVWSGKEPAVRECSRCGKQWHNPVLGKSHV